MVLGRPLSLRQSRRRQRLEERINHVGGMDSAHSGLVRIWGRSSDSSAADRPRQDPRTCGSQGATCFTQRCHVAMEKQGRVTIKKTLRKDGMTEYDLIYTPPILVSKGNYLKKRAFEYGDLYSSVQ